MLSFPDEMTHLEQDTSRRAKVLVSQEYIRFTPKPGGLATLLISDHVERTAW
jgi:hypothetical protein